MKLEWIQLGDTGVLYESRISSSPSHRQFSRRAEVSKQGVGVWIAEIIGPDYEVRERHEFPTEVIARNWTEAVVRLSGETLPNW